MPLCKLKNDVSPETAQGVQELLETYNAAPRKMTLTGATMPGTEDATALAVLKLYEPVLIQRMLPHVCLWGPVKLHLYLKMAGSYSMTGAVVQYH